MSLRADLEHLVRVAGPSGFEDEVASAVRAAVGGLSGVTDVDAIGNLFLRFPGPDGGRSLALFAHLDEVGLIVKYVDPQGYLFCEANGLVHEHTLPAARVDVWTRSGARPGVVGVKGRHLLDDDEVARAPRLADLWVDIGVASAGEASAAGVEIGSPVTFRADSAWLSGDLFVSKSIDNRAGCAVLIEVARRVAARQRDFALTFVWTTQEEIGARGARVAASSLQPTLAVVVDTVPAGDPSTSLRRVPTRVGAGPCIRVLDTRAGRGTVYSRSVTQRLREIAVAEAIPYQSEVAAVWTDAMEVNVAGNGVPTGGVYVPRRGSHTPSEIVDVRDVERAAQLVEAFVNSLDADRIGELATRPVREP